MSRKRNQLLFTPPLCHAHNPNRNIVHVPGRTRHSRTARKVGQPDILHISNGGLAIRQTMREVGISAGDVPAGDGRGRREDHQTGVVPEQVRKMRHEETAEALRGEVVLRSDLVHAHGGEDAVGGREGAQLGRVQARGDLGEDGEGVGALAFGEVGDGDVDDGVVVCAVVGEGFVEDGADGWVGAVDPVVDDSDGFVSLGLRLGRGGTRETCGNGVLRGWRWCRHDTVRESEVVDAGGHRSVDAYRWS